MNKPFDPIEVSLFSAIRVMPEAQDLATLVEKLELGIGEKDCRSMKILPEWSSPPLHY
jgi:hypothetical protein